MQNLLYNISQVLGVTILHSLWQGLIIYIALRLFLLATPAISSATKYRVSYATLVGMLGWFLATLFKELNQYNWLSTSALHITPLMLPAIMHEVNAPANQLYFAIARYMPYLTMVYVVGLVFNTLKLSLAWNSIYRIRQNISNAGFDQTVKRLSTKIKLGKTVQAAFSQWVDVPCVTGFIKPIILLPVQLTTYLSADEIEAILLHELAHVKRNDYLFNFIQQVIGILLFFNPFARLIATIINEERENCCDDTVVKVTGSPFLYAQALLKLEENKQQLWQLTLAATGKKYELLNRIERIMKTKTQTVNIRPVLIMVLALTCSITSIAWLNPEIKNGKVVIKNAPAIKAIAAAILTPEKKAEPTPKPKHKRNLSFKYVANTTAAEDTTKKKYKIVVEDENGIKTEYSSVNDLPATDRNDFLGKTSDLQFAVADSAMVNKLRKFYSSDKWKKQTEEMAKAGEKMAKHFNSPEWKKAQKKMVQQSMAMAKTFDSPEWKQQQKKLVEHSLEIAKAYTDPKFTKQLTDMALAGAAMGAGAAKYYESPEFKNKIEEITKYYDSPDFKKKVDDMAKYYDSPKFKKQIKEMTKYYDSPEFQKSIKEMTKYYDSPEFNKQMDDMGRKMDDMGKEMDKMGDRMDDQKPKNKDLIKKDLDEKAKATEL